MHALPFPGMPVVHVDLLLLLLTLLYVVSRRDSANEKIENAFGITHPLSSLHSVLGEKKMSHPFGKEEAASQKQLFGFFCECLRRGEWELARACVPQLHEGPGDLPKRVEDILQALVVCPNLLR